MMLLFNISRLHPLLVHLPIGILFFVALLFVLKLWGGSKKYDASIFQGLICSLGTAIFSAITGWLLSNEGGYDVDFLFWHKWLGISTTIGLALLLAFYRGINVYKANYYKTWYTGLFFVTLALLLATGHYGGSLTHGSEYLFEKPISQTTAVNTGLSIEEIPVYANLIQPILERKCVSCHKPSKKKGGLDMTEVARLMKGGRAGAIFDLEHPKNSAFLKEFYCPLLKKTICPQKGKFN